ncbi:hypothetical protein V6N12_045779 [Hibiscus sabdariffa]|uniref:Uncharacterized protein n=1 Tax=Hibiscus sabdariffa TaxID=183260 RepID=A0ABR2G4C7_9ROSI
MGRLYHSAGPDGCAHWSRAYLSWAATSGLLGKNMGEIGDSREESWSRLEDVAYGDEENGGRSMDWFNEHCEGGESSRLWESVGIDSLIKMET